MAKPHLFAALLAFGLSNSAIAQEIISSDAIVQSWALSVRSHVMRSALRYRGESAAAAVGFTLRRDGSVTNIRVLDASDEQAATLAAHVVQDAAPFPPMPGAVSADTVPFTIKIRFAGGRPHRRHG